MLLTLVVAVWLNAFLTDAKFADTYAAIEESRYGFALDSMGGTIQRGLDLGLPLEALPNVQKVMEEELAATGGLVAIVTDDKGTEVFRSGTSEPLPAGTGMVHQSLTDSLGRAVGTLSLYFSGAERARFSAQVNRVTLTATAVASIAGALAVIVIGSLLLGGVRKRLNAMAGDVNGHGPCDSELASARAVLDEIERNLSDLQGPEPEGAERS